MCSCIWLFLFLAILYQIWTEQGNWTTICVNIQDVGASVMSVWKQTSYCRSDSRRGIMGNNNYDFLRLFRLVCGIISSSRASGAFSSFNIGWDVSIVNSHSVKHSRLAVKMIISVSTWRGLAARGLWASIGANFQTSLAVVIIHFSTPAVHRKQHSWGTGGKPWVNPQPCW